MLKKRREFLKKLGLAGISLILLKSGLSNAGFLFRNKTTGNAYLRFENDGAIWTEYTVTRSYTYHGEGATTYTLVPLPYGIHYPINGVWGYDYNFVQELKINGVELTKGTDWRELTSSEKNGVSGYSGVGAFGGFAHAILLLNSNTITDGDTVEITVKQRELIAPSIQGLRVAPSVATWGDEVNTRGYTYQTPNVLSPRGTQNEQVLWSFPNHANFYAVQWGLSKKETGRWGLRPDNNVNRPVHQGQHWRPRTAVVSTQGKHDFYNEQIGGLRPLAFKYGLLHVPSGALSKPSIETIIVKKNMAYTGHPSLQMR